MVLILVLFFRKTNKMIKIITRMIKQKQKSYSFLKIKTDIFILCEENECSISPKHVFHDISPQPTYNWAKETFQYNVSHLF